jgi:tetratricopeptide (TPR) repeat protein
MNGLPMNAERWREIRALFDELADVSAATRAARLAAVAAGDPELRREVEALLSADTDAELRLAHLLAPSARLHDPLGLAGRTLSHFRVLEPLGAGGMGVVYVAEDERLGRRVALKVPRLVQHLDVSARRRFLQEARSAAALDHPNLCSIHEVGETEDGLPFLAMPLYRGETLAARLARDGALDVGAAVDIARQIARGLGAAHAAGIVHRDLKPGNVMLLPDGLVKVLDFGLARVREQSISVTGGMLGTAAYMAPEQIRSGPIDGRTDLWALGVVLYEMVTGRRPFRGEHDASLAHAIVHEEPAPLDPTVPADLGELIRALLEKDPDERPRDAAEVESRLGGGAAGLRAVTQPRRVRVAVITAILLTTAAVLGFAMFGRRPAARPQLDANLVAIAPFDAADPALQVWREGLADILSRNLDGAGPLRTVPPSVAFRRWGGRADRPAAEALGTRTGAALIVFGNVVRRGADSVGIRATVLDRSRGVSESNLEVIGAESRLGELADSLGFRILRLLGQSRPIGSTRHTSIGSRSFPALREFLQGEQFYRRGEIDSALAHYDRAVAADSTFALALRRMNWALGAGAATSWRYESFAEYGRRAVALNRGLAPRDSIMLLGDSFALSLRAARTPDALLMGLFRPVDLLVSLVRRYPDDPQVWYELGERHAHIPAPAGGDVTAALHAFDRAIALDSGFAPAYMHGLRLSLQQGDEARARRYARAFVSQGLPKAYTPGIEFAAHVLDSGGILAPTARAWADTAHASTLNWLANEHFRWWTDSAEAAVIAFREIADGGHDTQGAGAWTADTLIQRQELALALAFRGHLREATAADAVLLTNPKAAVGSYRYDVFPDLASFGLIDEELVRKSLADLWQLDWGTGGSPISPPRHLRLFDWLLSRGDTAALRRAAERGADMARSGREPLSMLRGRYFGRIAEAYLTMLRGDSAGAIRRLEAIPDSLCVLASCFDQKFTLARLLVAQGQDARAAAILDRWEKDGLPRAIHVVAALERARIAERLGDLPTAARHYRFVTEAWRRPDPELLAMVEEARAGMARTGRGQ